MITALPDVGSLPSPHLRFRQFLPSSEYAISNISVRHDDARWPTLRFDFSGEVSGRVKEFFLDWFYTGFPKNMMSSLVDSYSTVRIIHGIHEYFHGLDYKGIEAATAFMSGTCLEVEFSSGKSEQIRRFMSSFRQVATADDKPVECRFHRLGFHTSGHSGDWFEDRRVARLKWEDLDSSIRVGSHHLEGSSTGSLYFGNTPVHRYSVFQEGCFLRTLTVDLWNPFSDLEFLGYRLRDGGNFLRLMAKTSDGSPVLSLTDSGPGLAGVKSETANGVVAFSLGFTVDEIVDFVESERNWIISQLTG